ncbi:winged helix-turn-helix transcriptional regulator [Streptococcus mutans]|uniref:winged helix-turn-helix transcriptional regulator n=1 Tax=Streptococcus mutans TaxID=1309 RepID=UPI00124A706D|nr:winged helix-turn-helix transcriptional regulator [Streptococcus mutans]MCB4993566.1 winged helix-turn-helix transcriptional regulator [Streptococcus mutans]QFG40269.1 transcriptional regulator PadR-like family protein [Streptococcus mutans]
MGDEKLSPGENQSVLIPKSCTIYYLKDWTCQEKVDRKLSELERDGLISRRDYQQMPPKVVYSITDYGRTANTIIDVVCHCREDNIRRRQILGEEIDLISYDF